MSKIVELTNSLLDSANKVAGVVDDYTTNQAKLSTQSKQLKLQSDITNELNKIKRSSSYDKWQDDMNGFFERVKNEMTDENSQYYCKNNLQAQMFTSILEQNQVGVNEKVSQMVFTAEKDHAIVDYTNNLELISQQYTGQDYINKANEGAKLLYDSGYITEEQLQKQYDMNYQRAYTDAATKAFNGTVLESIKRGASEDEVISMVMDNLPEMMAIDTAGLPKSFDKEAMNETLKKTFKSDYRAILSDIQNKNESALSEIYANMLTKNSAQERNAIRRQGQQAIKEMSGLQLDSSTRARYAGYFALEDYLEGGTTTKAQASAAAKKMKPDDLMDYVLNAAKRGDESELGGTATYYDAWEFYQTLALEEYQSIPGNENATWAQLEKEYPVVGTFFEKAEKNLPDEFKDVTAFAEETMKTILNTKGNKDAYKEEYASVMNCVKDLLFETNVADLDRVSMEALKKRVVLAINGALGGVLEKNKQYKDYFEKNEGTSTLSNYQHGVFGYEGQMAKAMQERDANPDLVYTNQNGVKKDNSTRNIQEGLTRLEADERQELVKLVKSRTGKDIKPGSIDAHYENDGTHDISARKVYTIDGVDYRFRSEDGKKIILEEKKNGEKEWNVSKTDAQQKKYDSVDEQAKRAVSEKNPSTIPAGGFTYTDDNGKVQKFTYTDPEGEEKEITQTYWNHLRTNEKQRIIKEFLEQNPEAAQEWINSLPSKK